MRVSEAIMAGSMLLKSSPRVRNDGCGFGCALGMAEAALGIGEPSTSGVLSALERCHPWLEDRAASPCACPVTGFGFSMINCWIAHVFNEHVMGDGTWTLERLCDWVDSVDPTPRTVHEIVDDVMKRHEEKEDDEVDTDGVGDRAGLVRQG